MTVLFIAEAGVNHNGKLSLAKKMVSIAKKSGADFIKFQTYDCDHLLLPDTAKAPYQKKNMIKKNESQYSMLKKYQLSLSDHFDLIKECKKKKIRFLSSPFDIPSIKLLKKLKLDYIKIPSGEIINYPYLREVGKLRKKVLLSSGMANFSEIKNALNILIKFGTKKKNITVLHCHTSYPTMEKDVNMNSMNAIKEKFKVNIGYSDHTLGNEASLLAVAMGAKVIEKHFTLNRKLSGPDHLASATPSELKLLILSIRKMTKMFGSYIKKPTLEEKKNMKIVRKSIYAKKKISKGEKFSEENIITLRPQKGMPANKWSQLLNKKSKKNYYSGNSIEKN